MAIARQTPKCPKCGGSIKGIYADKGKTFVGDTFVMWDFDNHKCPESKSTLKCPLCKSENIVDISTYNNNGIFGHGSNSWKVMDLRSCGDCGIVFKQTGNNNNGGVD